MRAFGLNYSHPHARAPDRPVWEITPMRRPPHDKSPAQPVKPHRRTMNVREVGEIQIASGVGASDETTEEPGDRSLYFPGFSEGFAKDEVRIAWIKERIK